MLESMPLTYEIKQINIIDYNLHLEYMYSTGSTVVLTCYKGDFYVLESESSTVLSITFDHVSSAKCLNTSKVVIFAGCWLY